MLALENQIISDPLTQLSDTFMRSWFPYGCRITVTGFSKPGAQFELPYP